MTSLLLTITAGRHGTDRASLWEKNLEPAKEGMPRPQDQFSGRGIRRTSISSAADVELAAATARRCVEDVGVGSWPPGPITHGGGAGRDGRGVEESWSTSACTDERGPGKAPVDSLQGGGRVGDELTAAADP